MEDLESKTGISLTNHTNNVNWYFQNKNWIDEKYNGQYIIIYNQRVAYSSPVKEDIDKVLSNYSNGGVSFGINTPPLEEDEDFVASPILD